MNLFRLSLPAFVILAMSMPAQAQIFNLFKKRPPEPQSVADLVVTLRSDSEERRRSNAADKLRDYDANSHPEVVPALVDAALKDQKAGVRYDALSSLAKIRPVSQMAGQAIEQAVQSDDNWRNRLHAKSLLVGYNLAGYRNLPAKDQPQNAKNGKTGEPPLATQQQPSQPAIGQPLPNQPIAQQPEVIEFEPQFVPSRPLPNQGTKKPIYPQPLPKQPIAQQPIQQQQPVYQQPIVQAPIAQPSVELVPEIVIVPAPNEVYRPSNVPGMPTSSQNAPPMNNPYGNVQPNNNVPRFAQPLPSQPVRTQQTPFQPIPVQTFPAPMQTPIQPMPIQAAPIEALPVIPAIPDGPVLKPQDF